MKTITLILIIGVALAALNLTSCTLSTDAKGLSMSMTPEGTAALLAYLTRDGKAARVVTP